MHIFFPILVFAETDIIRHVNVTGKFEIQVEMISIQLNLILTWVEIESTKHEQKFNQLFASTCILVSKSVLEGREYG